jgi:asparagine synthase (glutamine-hydrolysing)
MCGICGIYIYGSKSEEVKEEILVGMRDTMIHRGPDDAGVYLSSDKRVGLAHRRLSIIDLSSAGRQPMSNEGLCQHLVGKSLDIRLTCHLNSG